MSKERGANAWRFTVAQLLRYSYQRMLQGIQTHGVARACPRALRSLCVFARNAADKNRHAHLYERKVEDLTSRIVQHKGFIDLIHVPMGWSTPLFQRFQHMSLQTAKLGGLAIYGGHLQIDKNLFVFEQVAANLYVIDALDWKLMTWVVGALKSGGQKVIVRIQSIDRVTSLEDVYHFIHLGFLVVYEYIDEQSEHLTRYIPRFVVERHDRMLEDERILVVATSDKLYQNVLRYRESNCVLSTNGVDPEHWRQTPAAPPKDMLPALRSGRIVVGYHGAVARWIDYGLLRAIVDRHDYEVVLIGYEHDSSFEESGLGSHPRVHFLGRKSYFELNKYASCYDVAILPFRRCALTDSASPVKLFEYMAAGKPIVTTDIPECKKYESCLVASSHEEFLSKLRIAWARRDDALYVRILDHEACRNSWENKLKEVLRVAGVQL